MATEIFSTKTIMLQDGTEVVLRPMVIGRLRRFMDSWKRVESLAAGDDGFDVFIDCAGIALETNFRSKFDSVKATAADIAEDRYIPEEYREYLLDTLDLDTIYEILKVCADIDLTDPKLQEAALQAMRNQEVGKSSTSSR